MVRGVRKGTRAAVVCGAVSSRREKKESRNPRRCIIICALQSRIKHAAARPLASRGVRLGRARTGRAGMCIAERGRAGCVCGVVEGGRA